MRSKFKTFEIIKLLGKHELVQYLNAYINKTSIKKTSNHKSFALSGRVMTSLIFKIRLQLMITQSDIRKIIFIMTW